MWRPSEIIINNDVLNDPITRHILSQCTGIPVRHIDDSSSPTVKAASTQLTGAGVDMLSQIQAGKQVMHIGKSGANVFDEFEIKDTRMMCPAFDKLVMASNGCFYNCDWCFLKLTYRSNQNYISVRVQYDEVKKRLERKLKKATTPVMFNTGEMADSLAMEHLTKMGQEFIPFFGKQDNGYLYLLTKSDNVNDILPLEHNERTIVAWSMNNARVSELFEVGAPSFERRLQAAQSVQNAGYPVRVRLDPIVPVDNWKTLYAETIERIFTTLRPERITLGTLRFEKKLYDGRNTFFASDDLRKVVGQMVPLLEEATLDSGKRSGGKYTFPDEKRIEMYGYVIEQIRRHNTDVPIALCKESQTVWEAAGLDVTDCKCACVYGTSNPTVREPSEVIYDVSEILGNDEVFVNRKLYQVPMEALHPDPDQPRKYIDKAALAELQKSIDKHGVIQPVLFRQDDNGKLIIIAGERRYRAAWDAELDDIPAVYIGEDNAGELALVENLLRENLNPIEEAEALDRLRQEQGYTLRQLSAVIGKKESTISEILSLNKLTARIKDKCRENVKVSRRALVEIAKAPTAQEMSRLFRKYEKKDLTSDELRQDTRQPRSADAAIMAALGTLQTQLQNTDLGSLDADKRTQVEERLRDVQRVINQKLS